MLARLIKIFIYYFVLVIPTKIKIILKLGLKQFFIVVTFKIDLIRFFVLFSERELRSVITDQNIEIILKIGSSLRCHYSKGLLNVWQHILKLVKSHRLCIYIHKLVKFILLRKFV